LRYSIVLGLLAVALLAASCGNDEEGPKVLPTLPPGTPAITDSHFDFPARGYSVEIPDGWTPDANYISGPEFATDAFFAPQAVGEVKPNISVTCAVVEAGITTDNYAQGKLELIRGLAKSEPNVSSRQVAGLSALAVEYQPQVSGVEVEKIDIIFVRGPCGWTITLTAPGGRLEEYRDIFESFLASYQVLEQ